MQRSLVGSDLFIRDSFDAAQRFRHHQCGFARRPRAADATLRNRLPCSPSSSAEYSNLSP
jgi:hypothetical protein